MHPESIILPWASKRYEDLQSFGGGALIAVLAWSIAFPLIPDPWGFQVAVGVSAFSTVGVLVDIFILNRLQWKYFEVKFSNGVLSTQTGRFIVTESSIRRDAVLSVDLQTGPILRRWGLARVKLHGIASFPTIPVLTQADALAIKRALTDEPHNVEEFGY